MKRRTWVPRENQKNPKYEGCRKTLGDEGRGLRGQDREKGDEKERERYL